MSYYLGVDIGTTGTRAVLIDKEGKVIGGQSADHEPISTPQPQWAEQNPENWWAAARRAVTGILRGAGIKGGAIQGVGLSGQMHGLGVLDKENQGLRPSIIWGDQRCQAEAGDHTRAVGQGKLI